jgi:ubiquinone/menaquinone biosynthesis C-methylase UbiE
MTGLVCPWWGGYLIDNRLRRLMHNPEKIVGPYVRQGMTVMDVGCGMGLFSIAMAKMVGDQGQVIAVDLQQQMLDVLRRRAIKAEVANRIQFQKCGEDHLAVDAKVDFVLTFAMIHEVPDQRRLLSEIQVCLKPEGEFLIAEPRLHVPARAFEETVTLAKEIGFQVVEEPCVRWCRAVVLVKL